MTCNVQCVNIRKAEPHDDHMGRSHAHAAAAVQRDMLNVFCLRGRPVGIQQDCIAWPDALLQGEP